MNTEKTHWRKIHDTEHLGSHDIDGMPAPIIFKISGATSKEVRNAENKKDTTVCITFEGVKKPMLVNVTNSEAIEKVTGSGYIEDWVGHEIELRVEMVNAFGTRKSENILVPAIRVYPRKPIRKPTVTIGSKMFDQLLAKLKNRETTIEAARNSVVISPEVETALNAALNSESLPEVM